MRSTLVKSGRRIADKLHVDNQTVIQKADISQDSRSGTYKITLEITTKMVASDPGERQAMYDQMLNQAKEAVAECVEFRKAFLTANGEQGELDLEGKAPEDESDDEEEDRHDYTVTITDNEGHSTGPISGKDVEKKLRMGRKPNAAEI